MTTHDLHDPIDDEVLSRLLDGDLPPEERARVQAAVDADPDLEARLDALRELTVALGLLPLDAPDASELERALEGAPAPRRAWAGTAVAALAALLLGVLWLGSPATPGEVAVGFGHHGVDGSVALAVGDTRVRVDGVAVVDVEPAPGPARDVDEEERSMRVRDGVLGAMVGAAVTVSVQQGSAWIEAPAGVQVLGAGQTARAVATLPTDAMGDSQTAASQVRVVEVPADLEQQPVVQALQEETVRLRAALKQAEMEAEVAQAQLEAATGRPSDWPEDVEDGWTPEATRARLDGLEASFDGVEIAELDCGEYPCIAVMELPLSGDSQADQELIEQIQKQGAPAEDVGAMVLGTGIEDDDGNPLGLTLVTAWMPKGGAVADPVHVRTRSRLDALAQAWAPEAPQEGMDPD